MLIVELSALRTLPVGSETIMDNQIWMKTGGKCWYDGLEASTVDHVTPTKRGGTELIENLVPACEHCNFQKRDRTLEEYRRFLSLKEVSKLAGVPFTEGHVNYLMQAGIEFELPIQVFWAETDAGREHLTRIKDQAAYSVASDESALDLDKSWKLFSRHFGHRPFMTENELKVCKIVYVNSHAKGRPEYSVTVASLAQAAGITMRSCFATLARLQKNGFISRERDRQINSTRIAGLTLCLILNPFSANEFLDANREGEQPQGVHELE